MALTHTLLNFSEQNCGVGCNALPSPNLLTYFELIRPTLHLHSAIGLKHKYNLDGPRGC